MVKIEIVNPAEYLDRARALLCANWAETGFDFEFNPSVEMYRSAYDAGFMFALCAFDGGEIVGYCTVLVTRHIWNPSVICASNDALFIKPRYRGLTSGRMIKRVETEAKARGATQMLWHTRAGTPLADMMQKRGYQPADVVVIKEL